MGEKPNLELITYCPYCNRRYTVILKQSAFLELKEAEKDADGCPEVEKPPYCPGPYESCSADNCPRNCGWKP